ncbi:uncharacterized protein LOC108669218, partial [Hyalella azteca]|uniref:Uncharacterized protein LOC108669218 n=1 Tax=Hyalella azteca TaxID=294128 RepID=A0A979FIN0_HYAAZ
MGMKDSWNIAQESRASFPGQRDSMICGSESPDVSIRGHVFKDTSVCAVKYRDLSCYKPQDLCSKSQDLSCSKPQDVCSKPDSNNSSTRPKIRAFDLKTSTGKRRRKTQRSNHRRYKENVVRHRDVGSVATKQRPQTDGSVAFSTSVRRSLITPATATNMDPITLGNDAPTLAY